MSSDKPPAKDVAAATLRWRRWRDRDRKSASYAECDLPNSLVAHFIACGFLSEADANAPKKIGEALVRWVQDQKRRLTS